MFRRSFLRFAALLPAGVLVGCGAPDDATKQEVSAVDPGMSLAQKTPIEALVCGMDTSGSFASFFGNGGPAARLLDKIVREFFIRSAGEDERTIMIGQISGSTTAPLFHGSPSSFSQFDLEVAFAANNIGGSRCWDSAADICNYASSIIGPNTRTLVVICSDFDDNASKPAGEDRFTDALKELAKKRASVACYWVALDKLDKVKECGRKAQFPPGHFAVHAIINVDPPLPVIDP